MASERDQAQSIIGYADGLPVAAKGEFGDRVKTREDGREVDADLRGGVESEAVSTLPLHGEPTAADQGAPLPVPRAQGLEDQS